MTPLQQIGWNYFQREWDLAKLKERFDQTHPKAKDKQQALVRLRAWLKLVRQQEEVGRN